VSERPKISVVVPTHNRRQVLPRAIASVLAQDKPDFELIIVDDCSADDTPDYLASLQDPRIRSLRSERNVGCAAARNLGLEAARAEIVAFLDDDDVYLQHRLAAPLAVFARQPQVVCTLSSSIKVKKKSTEIALMPELILAAPAFEWALIADLVGVESSGISVRRPAALEAGGFKAGMKATEDREFLIRLSRTGGGALIGEPLWQKYWSDDSLSNQWARDGTHLLEFIAERREYANRFRKLGSYLATKILVADLRHRMFRELWRDLRGFRAAGLIDGNPVRMWRDHREVRSYRRGMRSAQALAALAGPPDEWA
jgi:glycosyltransferase involved in cell wall biosynthesis